MGKTAVLPKSVDLGYNFFGCENPKRLVCSKRELYRLELFFCDLVARAGFTPVHSYSYPHDNGSYSMYVLIEESMVTVYTWPEHKWVEVRIHFCNYETDNTGKGKALVKAIKKYFKPGRVQVFDPRFSNPE